MRQCTYSFVRARIPKAHRLYLAATRGHVNSIIRFVRGENNDYDGQHLSLRQVGIANTAMSGGEQVVGKVKATRSA